MKIFLYFDRKINFKCREMIENDKCIGVIDSYFLGNVLDIWFIWCIYICNLKEIF